MRELKFRCWGIKENKYLKLHSIHLSTSKVIVSDYGVGGGNVSKALKDVILEQYIGIKDWDGKEIYEGDIVSIDSVYEELEPSDCKLISFRNGCFRVGDGYEDEAGSYLRDCGVIGNIHENPGLLKGEKE